MMIDYVDALKASAVPSLVRIRVAFVSGRWGHRRYRGWRGSCSPMKASTLQRLARFMFADGDINAPEAGAVHVRR
jgi:hypothetical protein